MEQFDDDDTISISVISIFKFVSMLSEFRFFSFEIVFLCNQYQLSFCFLVLFFSWQTLDAYNSRIVSLRGNVKLYYIIEYNTFLLFVGFLLYFDKFFILSTLEFISYQDSSSKSI